jgi:hypothetical protein
MKRLIGYEVSSSHFVRQCHPETCCCSTDYVVEAIYRKGCDHSTDTRKIVFADDSKEECEYFIKRVTN